MKYSKKWHIRFAYSMFVACVFLSVRGFAQTDRNELKLQNLKNKIAMAESKVSAAELRLSRADSMINDGDLRISQAEEEFTLIGEEQKKLEKDYRTDAKALQKLARSKDNEIAGKAEDDLKILETKYREDSKMQASRIKMLTRQATKAESDVEKGLDMKKSAISKLKDAQKDLELARKNYEDFAGTLESK
jgi:chromosome segregation ATPase